MTKFIPGKPVVTDSPVIVVDPGLPPGIHHFRLAVHNDRGIESVAVIHAVLVIKLTIFNPGAGPH